MIQVQELNDTNCKSYLLRSGRRAALVDPVRERVPTYLAVLAQKQLELEWVLETHTHADHLMLNREAKQRLGAAVVIHRAAPSPLADRHIEEGDTLRLGDELIRVLHTPGHTPDSVSYLMEGAVLTGDTLLIGGSGRTDFPGGDPGAQWDGVHGKLFTLPDETVVFPAHDYNGKQSSTIGREKRENARYRRSRAEYVELMNHLGLPLPDRIQQALQINQSGFEQSEVHFPLVAEIAIVPEIDAGTLARALGSATPPVLIDVREPEEFVGELGHIRGALLIPLDLLELRLPKLAGYVGRGIVAVCRAGARSASAAAMLRAAGFPDVKNLAGGMLAWVDAKLAVER